MVVGCPKCKVKLKVADEKIGPEGLRVKCPKCSTVLMVRMPTQKVVPLDRKKVLVAHQDPKVVERISAVLSGSGYSTVPSTDGVDAMIKVLKELPFMVIVDVALPKIFGFEVAKRLKQRAETRQTKVILISSIYDKTRYRREPATLYGADEYIDEHLIESLLLDKIASVIGEKKEERPAPAPPRAAPVPEAKPAAVAAPTAGPKDEKVERAKRLARTIVSDIYIYDTAKCDEAIRTNTFYSVFASELEEAMKLYKSRVSEEVMKKGDFFKEAIENFMNKKRAAL